MADAYLNIAERVLLSHGAPLRPHEILELAYIHALTPNHLYGITQHKTLHARLSEDISKYRENSRFYRVAPGVFFLRSYIQNHQTRSSQIQEYMAPPRKKELKKERMLAINNEGILSKKEGEISITEIKNHLYKGFYNYYPYSEIQKDKSLISIYSFVIVYREDFVLSFRTGKFSPSTDPLRGQRSIGVGGAIFSNDVDMLFESLYGIISNGVSELSYAIGLPRRLAEKARYNNELQPWCGFFVPKSSRHSKVLHVIMGYECPIEFTPFKGALSVNDLRWINLKNPGNNIDDFDQTSQFIFSLKRLPTQEVNPQT